MSFRVNNGGYIINQAIIQDIVKSVDKYGREPNTFSYTAEDSKKQGFAIDYNSFEDSYNILLLGVDQTNTDGVGMIYIEECKKVPTIPPINGGYIYIKDGKLCFKGKNGTETILANS